MSGEQKQRQGFQEEGTNAKKTVCMWCHNHCSVNVHVQKDRLIKIEENTERRGSKRLRKVVNACDRIKCATDWFYHPERLTHPLKRTGAKGEGKWEHISWEQALDEIATRLAEIKEKYGAEAVASSSGTGRTHDEYRSRFLSLFGTPNQIGQGNICFGPATAASSMVCGGSYWSPIRETTKCVMLWGTNPQQSYRRTWFDIIEGKKKGARLIVVDPRRTVPAQRADIWLQIKPGTDCALAMGMIHVIINEELYDKTFVSQWCYGFNELVERSEEYPPEKVAKITWISADQIRQTTRMYAGNSPAIILTQMGMEHIPNSMEALQARYILTAITGNLDVKGGERIIRSNPKIISAYDVELNHMMPHEQKVKQIGADRFKCLSFPGFELRTENATKVHAGCFRHDNCFAHAPSVYEAMITDNPYPVRAMITLASNPLITQANTKHVYQALKGLDLYVVMDFWLTSSAELADYVLPAASWLERPVLWTWFDTSPVLEAGEAALPHQIEGQYDRRRDYDLWRELGIRLGQEDFWPWQSLEDAYSYRLMPLGYNLHDFINEKGGIEYPQIEERAFESQGFATPTGRVELYSTILEKLGYDPLPKYQEAVEGIKNTQFIKQYPFILITGSRHLPFFHSEHRQITYLRKKHPDPLVQINPKTAKELDICDGDLVWIETPRGRVRQKCQYSNGIDPRVISAEHGWWFPELPGEEPSLHGVWESNINVVTNDDPNYCNPMSGGWPLRTLMCRIYRA